VGRKRRWKRRCHSFPRKMNGVAALFVSRGEISARFSPAPLRVAAIQAKKRGGGEHRYAPRSLFPLSRERSRFENKVLGVAARLDRDL
jgi:hypothetical protein